MLVYHYPPIVSSINCLFSKRRIGRAQRNPSLYCRPLGGLVGYAALYPSYNPMGNDDNSPTNKVLGGTLPAAIFKTIALAQGN